MTSPPVSDQKTDALILALFFTDVPPIITKHPENATVHVGQDHHLTCEGKSSPPPSYNWLHNDGVISDPYIIQTGGDLHIASIASFHNGWYTCVIKNEYGAVAAKAYVNVVKGTVCSSFNQFGKTIIPALKCL